VKIAWRNPSMHVDIIYSEEIAEDIYIAIRRLGLTQLNSYLIKIKNESAKSN